MVMFTGSGRVSGLAQKVGAVEDDIVVLGLELAAE